MKPNEAATFALRGALVAIAFYLIAVGAYELGGWPGVKLVTGSWLLLLMIAGTATDLLRALVAKNLTEHLQRRMATVSRLPGQGGDAA